MLETPLGMNANKLPPTSKDADWLDEVRRGDPAAFSNLYRTHISAVYWYALRLLKNTVDAEDASHDVFVLAWEKRTRIRIVDESILPWLLVSTRNLCLNRLKKTNRERSHRAEHAVLENTVATGPSAAAELESQELRAAILAAVDRLSDTDQQLYYLCIEEGSSYADAARVLNTTHNSVRSRLSRLRLSLRLSLVDQKERLS
ncbi:MAG: sigma-70 family RNA polymerase sigma factor [Candidatus Saccharibacteria bacterium]|nr:sigma-70 family RNA polymerase sigma factor [Microbacteriaceae bacterium]